MKAAKLWACAVALIIAAPSVASAGPTLVPRLDTVAATFEPQVEPIHYKKYRHAHRRGHAPDPVRGVTGTAVGMAGVGVNTAVGTGRVVTRGWCDFWGYCR
jgi:hypothetical protein